MISLNAETRVSDDKKKGLIIIFPNTLNSIYISITEVEYEEFNKLYDKERKKTIRLNPEYYGLKKGDKVY